MSLLPNCQIYAVPAADFHLTRADFLARLGGGLFIVLAEISDENNPENGSRPRGWNADFGRESGAYLHIGINNCITSFTGKVEVGQDIRTCLSQIVAEELAISPADLRLVMGDTDVVPFDMGTFGSRSTPFTVPQFRHIAAAARELLLDLAAASLQAPRAALTAGQGSVHHLETGRSLSFGELAGLQTVARQLPADAATAAPRDWKISGQSAPKTSARAMVTGAHRFTSDLKYPGMLWGKILRPPCFGAELLSLDASRARAIPGIVVVREGDFVGVAAPHPATAEAALSLLKVEWTTPIHAQNSQLHRFSRETETDSTDALQGARNSQPFVQGDVAAGFADADFVVEASYDIAFIAHAPLEPRAALAHWNDLADGEARLTVWTGTQRPFGVRDDLAQALEIAPERVRVIVPDTGSGYGGKHTGEAALEAAKLARAARAPVKLVWTREEEFTWAYNRPGGAIDVKAGVSREGKLLAWEYHNINSGSSGLATPYDAAHQWLEFHAAEAPLRQGSYRALASTANHFAREAMMDELAAKIGLDPLQFRLQNLSNPRMRAVLEAAARAFGWGEAAPPNHGFGLAVGTEKAGFIATCAEISVKNGEIKVERLTSAFECGAILNPDNLRSQIEGALIQGLGGALFEAVRWSEGRIETDNFSTYRVPRFSDLPRLETLLLNRPDLPSEGAGESPLVAVAPAIANAFFAATGERRRSMPLQVAGT